MHSVRRTLLSLTALCALAVFAGIAAPGGSAAAADADPQLPQASAAIEAAQWLAGQLTSSGYIAGPSPGTADLSATANTVLALAATSVDPSGAQAALNYLEANSSSFIPTDGSDGPGPLSLLILDAEALGADPTSFGGTNLVSRLEATEETTGGDAGLFGTTAQLDNYDAGTYDQGLALSALKAAGVGANASAISWLVQQQCADGGWALPDIALNTCTENPADFAGPDTNTTSAALQGLAAQDALSPTISSNALTFYQGAQNTDGGWGYQPTNSSDPDSTSLAIQALLALGQSPTGTTYTKDGETPVTSLLSFQITSGASSGAFSFPGGGATTGNLIATYQATPAAAGLTFPFTAPPDPPPSMTAVAPSTGSTSGGTAVTVTGTNFTTAGEVSFGATLATFTVVSSTSITATAPAASSAGPVDITVTTLGGTSSTGAADTFTYIEATTTTTTTTTTTAPATTSTSPATGLSMTGAVGTSGSSGGGGSSGSSGALALTGFDLALLVSGGLMLIGVGALAVLAARPGRRGRHVRRAGS